MLMEIVALTIYMHFGLDMVIILSIFRGFLIDKKCHIFVTLLVLLFYK